MNLSKGLKNVSWGIISQIVTIGLGILIPRLILVNLGSEANGLLSSIGSILTYLALLEAGVGTASLQALYVPFGNNDKESINKIMAATHFFYKRTGYIYLCIVFIVSIIYSLTIQTTIPKLSVFICIVLSGLSSVLSYFFQGKFRIFLMAEGKSYIITNVTTFCYVLLSLSKTLALILGGNIITIQLITFFNNGLQVFILSYYMKKHYKWLDIKVEPNLEALSQKKAVLVHQLTEMVFNNTDVIVLTVLTSLKVVSVYSMYAMIFGMVKSVSVTFSDGFLYALGQSFDDKKNFEKLFNIYEIFNMALTFSLFCIAGILIIPFLKLYTSGVNDINYIDTTVAALFVAFYLMQNGRKSSQVVINIAQHFEKTKWRSIIEATINLSVSIVGTIYFGIYGVLWGTIIALFYRTNDVILYSSKIMEKSPLITYRRWFRNLLLFIFFYIYFNRVGINSDSYVSFLIYGFILSIIIIPSFVIVNSIIEKEYSKYILQFAYQCFRRNK